VPDHPRQHQAALGDHALFLERTAMEVRVGEDGLARHFVEGDVLRRQLGCRGDGQAVAHAVRVGDGPLQRLHAAQAAADHGGPLADAQASARRAWLCTQSSTVSTGKSAPNGLPVAGLRLLGPVEPLQPPRLFRLTTKNLLVSMGLPGPMQLSHQPGLRSSGLW
jgi:hypothetical protein